jgi:hypothetical protein
MMVDRDITGEIRRVGLNRLPALLGIDSESLKELAERVRQFDQAQSNDTRQRKALEKVALLIGQSTLIENQNEKYTRRDNRKREIEALELMAVAQAYPYEELRQTDRFERLVARLGVRPGETRNEGETRD